MSNYKEVLTHHEYLNYISEFTQIDTMFPYRNNSIKAEEICIYHIPDKMIEKYLDEIY